MGIENSGRHGHDVPSNLVGWPLIGDPVPVGLLSETFIAVKTRLTVFRVTIDLGAGTVESLEAPLRCLFPTPSGITILMTRLLERRQHEGAHVALVQVPSSNGQPVLQLDVVEPVHDQIKEPAVSLERRRNPCDQVPVDSLGSKCVGSGPAVSPLTCTRRATPSQSRQRARASIRPLGRRLVVISP